MPPKAKINRQQIIDSAFELVRKDGAGSLNARTLAKRMGCSTQPLFYNFASMEELQESVVEKANEFYGLYIQKAISQTKYPPYKASGMAYIQFAKDEGNLFRLLFMRDRTNEKSDLQKGGFEEIVSLLMSSYGLSREEAMLFHLEMWAMTHGLASMQVTAFLELDDEMTSTCLTDTFEAFKLRLSQKRKDQQGKGE